MKNILNVKEVSKTYGKQTVLDKVSFSINEGEIVGLVGPNGAGKTTIMKIITGLTPKYEGSVYIDNENIKSMKKEVTKKVGCVIESPGFYPSLSGYENLKFFAEVSGLKDMKQIDEIVEILQLQNAIHKKASKYSLGMKQRLGIAQAILTYPKLLILDEPTNGLDPNIIPQIRRFIINIAKKKNIAVLISSHNLAELDVMCNRVIFMNKGKIIEQQSELTCDNEQILIKIKTSKPDIMKEFLASQKINICEIDGDSFILEVDRNEIENLTSEMFKNGIPFSTVEELKESLEDKYLKIVRGDLVE